MDADRVIATYERNYSMLQTFEPFRRGGRNLALISPDYTATSSTHSPDARASTRYAAAVPGGTIAVACHRYAKPV